jgi:putative lumazine-binding protein
MTDRMDDLEAVAAVVQMYVDGAARADVELLRDAFFESARMYGNEDDVHFDVPIQDFFDEVASLPVPGPRFRSHVVSIDVVGDAGVAVLAEDDYQGMNYVNFFSLVKLEGRWRIANKTFAMTGLAPSPLK